MSMSKTTDVLVDRIMFPESPRWRADELWFVDMFAGHVMTMTMAGQAPTVVTDIGDEAGGIGFLPDGTPLVVAKRNRQILRLEAAGPTVHCDLRGMADVDRLNDMVVDQQGRAYVDAGISNMDQALAEGYLVMVEPSGSFRIAASQVPLPNGLVLTPDGQALIQAATWRHQLLQWTIAADGTLSRPRVWADTKPHQPDGICCDSADAIWIGGLKTGQFARILPGGTVAETIDLDGHWAIACALGGPDGRTLFMTTCEPKARWRDEGHGFIEVAQVDVPGVGSP